MTAPTPIQARHDVASLSTVVSDIWTAAGIHFRLTVDEANDARAVAVIADGMEQKALGLAFAGLRGTGARVCYERTSRGWTVFSFPLSGRGLQLDLLPENTSAVKRILGAISQAPRIAPFVALVGPDGVGKSTVLELVRARLSDEAPFLAMAFFQWRPNLLPALSRIAGKPEPTGPYAFKPRRTPGRFQFIRVAYYFSDYLAGSWWKLRKSAAPRFLVFDRCALDMEVDPVRFGLPTKFGIRTLWRAIPKPLAVVLLHDDAKRIAARKDDLEEHEIRRQLNDWLALAEVDKVTAAVEVDREPREIADRVYQVFIDAFVAAHEQDLRTGDESGIERADRLLGVTRVDAKPVRYAALPSRGAARFLVPLDTSPRAASAGLKIYNAQRPIARFARAIAGWTLRTGIAKRLWVSPVFVNSVGFQRRLSGALGREVSLAIALGSGAHRDRIVIQATDADGTIAGYAKVGSGAEAVEALRHEEAILRSLSGVSFQRAVVPRVLAAFDFGTARVLVQSAPPASVSKAASTDFAQGGLVSKDGDNQPQKPLHADSLPHGGTGESGICASEASALHLEFLADLQRCSQAPMELLIASRAVEELRRAGYTYYSHQVEWAARELASANLAVPGALAHGDFTPWNMLISNGRLFVFDWEFARKPVPPAYDLFHFLAARAVEIQGSKPGAIFGSFVSGEMNAATRRYLTAIGVSPELWRPLLIWYCADALARSIAAVKTSADSKEESMRRTWSALLMLCRYKTTAESEGAR